MAEINALIPEAELEGLSRRDRKKQQTRWRIYNAGIALMRDQGFDQVTIEQICETADVSSALFFHHFSSKVSLVGAFIERLKSDIARQLEAAGEVSSVEKLQIITRDITRASENSVGFSPQLLSEMIKSDGALNLQQVDTGITGLLSTIIRDGQKSGEFSGAWHPEVVAISLIGAWLMLPIADQSDSFPADSVREHLDLILSGLKT